MSVQFNESYPSAEAERGKFVPIDISTLSGYPSGGRGKYAVLVYNVGTATGSGGTTQTQAAGGPGAGQNSGTITQAVSTFTFSPAVQQIELQNVAGSNAWFLVNNVPSDAGTLSSTGLLLTFSSYYTLEKQVTSVSLYSELTSDVRIIGHY